MVGVAAGRLANLGMVLAWLLGMGPLVAAVGMLLVDSVSSLPRPVRPGRVPWWGWSAPRAPEGAVLVRQDRCSAVGTLCRRVFESGCCAPWAVFTAMPPLSQRIPRFASVITLAKRGIPLRTPLRLQNSPCARPRGGAPLREHNIVRNETPNSPAGAERRGCPLASVQVRPTAPRAGRSVPRSGPALNERRPPQWPNCLTVGPAGGYGCDCRIFPSGDESASGQGGHGPTSGQATGRWGRQPPMSPHHPHHFLGGHLGQAPNTTSTPTNPTPTSPTPTSPTPTSPTPTSPQIQ